MSGNVSDAPSVINENNHSATESPMPYTIWAGVETQQAASLRQRMATALGLSHVALPRLLHTDTIQPVDPGTDSSDFRRPRSERPVADAVLVADAEGQGSLMAPADCVVLSVAWPGESAVAQIHSGIRGMARELIPKAFAAFGAAGLPVSQARVYAAPFAHNFQMNAREQAEVETIVQESGDEAMREYPTFTTRGLDGLPIMHMGAFLRSQLFRAGVIDRHVQISPLDTRREESLFSDYRSVTESRVNGRFGVMVGIRPDDV